MILKHYQERVLKELKIYLYSLAEFRTKYEKALAYDSDMARDYNFPLHAWEAATGRGGYVSHYTGIGSPLPDVYLKVPTGGGKTLLACHAIDLIHKIYLKRQNGLVLWIVPSDSIYRQTIKALKDRNNPYRQLLDVSSGGRTLIKEKADLFTNLDVAENLVVLMLMLPSAARQNKETLRMFRDRGGFADFYPAEDNYPAQEELLRRIPNLDVFSSSDEVFGTQVKTSLGNTLRTLKPVVIMDEGHKAYSANARQTITGFNPSFLLELSATPPKGVNELVRITGRELHDEEMIKLDIHLINKASLEWKDTLLAAYEKRASLEDDALKHEANTGRYIRPACLIQVERTGRDQRDGKYIHAEDVKEYLIKKCSVPPDQIAIKSSEKDDIEGIDLMSRDCAIRYIITKQALQEGWDYPFAYILAILTNPSSSASITQLVGRILRQPYAQKTGITSLDECYVYTFRQNAGLLVREIKRGLEEEGLGDLAGRIVSDDGIRHDELFKERILEYRPGFKKFEGRIYLPKFVVQDGNVCRDLMFEADILPGIDWDAIPLDSVGDIVLNPDLRVGETDLAIGYPEEDWDYVDVRGMVATKGTLQIDMVFLARQLGDIIPNPWVAYDIGKKAMDLIFDRYRDHEVPDIVERNFVFIIEELKKILERERDVMAEAVFRRLLEEQKLVFFILKEKGGFVIPSRISVKTNRQLTAPDGSQIQRSLFDYVPEENLNELENKVAVYLDKQEKLLFWYRNISRRDYHIQGWKRHKIYPDFIAAAKDEKASDEFDTVYVLETKGLHLKNEDTTYKQNMFALCNEIGTKVSWDELFDEFPNHRFEFQVLFEDEWENKMNKLLH